MAEDFIPRLRRDPDGLDFAALRQQGIAWLQELSHENWTDYNLHDPGVTLLELLCYGLTDLGYRSGFEVAELLSGPTGEIDYRAQALLPPPQAFPCEPVTDADLCKLIYDALPQVDDVWLCPGAIGGLYTVYIKRHEALLAPAVAEAEEPGRALHEQVATLLARHRGLCRDVERICMVTSQPHTLCGEIEIDDSRPAAEICAEIYFQCANLISSGGRIARFEDVLARGMSWEEVLDGPLPRHGYVEDGHFDRPNYTLDAMTLVGAVGKIPGVRRVRRLRLRDAGGAEVDQVCLAQAGEVCPVLAFPATPQELQALRLVHGKGTDPLPAELQDGEPRLSAWQAGQFHELAALYLRKREFEHAAFRRNDGHLTQLLKLPHGSHHELAEYSAVGEHAPAMYGINREGVPRSAPPEVHLRAGQLKAFLYPFEQTMANYLASLRDLRRLYSLDDTLERSYSAQVLRNDQVPGLEALYRERFALDSEVDSVQAELDDFGDRRNRVLDNMLAVYGEVFPGEALRRHDCYFGAQVERHLIDCKIGLLRHLGRLNARRGIGMNVRGRYWNGCNYAALQQRVQLLSGASKKTLGRSLTVPLRRDGLQYLGDQRYREMLAAQAGYPEKPGQGEVLVWAGEGASAAAHALPHDAVCPALLLAGVRLANYRSLPAGEGQAWLCVAVDDGPCWPIARVAATGVASQALAMQRRLVELSRACDGFHLLEHVLLRPRDASRQRAAVAEDYYAHRVSIVLPAFTARGADPGCRAWLEDLIAQQLPAHILPTFHWLDFVYLSHFEQCYRAWLELLRAVDRDEAGLVQLDEAAEKLISVLGSASRRNADRIWL